MTGPAIAAGSILGIELGLQLHQGIGKIIQTTAQLVERADLLAANGSAGVLRRGYLVRPLAKDLFRQQQQLRRLVERFSGVDAKQMVRPGNQVVQISHHHRFHERLWSHLRQQIQTVGFFPPGFNLFAHLFAPLLILFAQIPPTQQQHRILNRLATALLEERFDLPDMIRPGRTIIIPGNIRWIENVVKPALGCSELLVFAKPQGQQKGDMEKQFPVVTRIGAGIGKIKFLDRFDKRQLQRSCQALNIVDGFQVGHVVLDEKQSEQTLPAQTEQQPGALRLFLRIRLEDPVYAMLFQLLDQEGNERVVVVFEAERLGLPLQGGKRELH